MDESKDHTPIDFMKSWSNHLCPAVYNKKHQRGESLKGIDLSRDIIDLT